MKINFKSTIVRVISAIVLFFSIWVVIRFARPNDNIVKVYCDCYCYFGFERDTCIMRHELKGTFKKVNDSLYYSFDGIYYIKYALIKTK